MIDLVHRAIEVHTDPGDGLYRRLETRRRGDSITLTSFADVAVAVADVVR